MTERANDSTSKWNCEGQYEQRETVRDGRAFQSKTVGLGTRASAEHTSKGQPGYFSNYMGIALLLKMLTATLVSLALLIGAPVSQSKR